MGFHYTLKFGPQRSFPGLSREGVLQWSGGSSQSSVLAYLMFDMSALSRPLPCSLAGYAPFQCKRVGGKHCLLSHLRQTGGWVSGIRGSAASPSHVNPPRPPTQHTTVTMRSCHRNDYHVSPPASLDDWQNLWWWMLCAFRFIREEMDFQTVSSHVMLYE